MYWKSTGSSIGYEHWSTSIGISPLPTCVHARTALYFHSKLNIHSALCNKYGFFTTLRHPALLQFPVEHRMCRRHALDPVLVNTVDAQCTAREMTMGLKPRAHHVQNITNYCIFSRQRSKRGTLLSRKIATFPSFYCAPMCHVIQWANIYRLGYTLTDG